MGYEIGYCYVDKVSDGQLMTYVTLYSETVDVSQDCPEIWRRRACWGSGISLSAGGSTFPPEASVNYDFHLDDNNVRKYYVGILTGSRTYSWTPILIVAETFQ